MTGKLVPLCGSKAVKSLKHIAKTSEDICSLAVGTTDVDFAGPGVAEFTPATPERCRDSLQLIGDLVDACLDARLVLFAAGRTRGAGCTDDLFADLDGKRALIGDDIGQMNQAECRIGLHALDKRTR